MRVLAQLGVVVAVTLLVPSAVFAQATLSGVVRDTSGAVMPGVTIEAASPALIEKTRTTVSDGNGRYQIVDLRPGTYTVTFTLAGFNTVKRDGVALSGSATVSVDADLRVGALEETITVTGEAPIVDTQSLTRQQVLTGDLVDALPSARNYFGLARMIPGTSGGGNDVGGSLIQDTGQSVTVHGSRNVDQRVTVNGVNTMTLQAGGNIGGQTPDVGSAQEVTVDTTSLSADLPTGGVRINFVPRDGGNNFSNSTFFTFSNESLQGDNFSDELRAAGLATPNKIVKNWDVNESLGGPFKRDKVWFWFSARINQVENNAAVLVNRNAFDPTKWLYEPVEGQPGVNKGYQINSSIRVTWQATPRNKIAGTYKADKWCNCPNNISATVAPEAARDRRFPRLAQEHLEWTSPVTNRLLFEAVGLHLYERWGNMHLRVNGGSLENESQEAILREMVSVQEQSNGLRYRALDTYNNTRVPSFTYRAAASYVTGTHAVKVGFNRTHGYLEEYNYALIPYSYRFNNGVPNQITVQARPYTSRTNLDNDLGLYAQDRWTLNRLTASGAVRFDYFATSFPEQTLGPAPLTPTRSLTFPAEDNISWKDLTYRTGLAYDVFGTGRTAIKVSFNKYLLGQTLNGLGRDPNPVLALVTSTTRSWTDSNRNFVHDCDLVNPLQNGECGPIADTGFGTTRPGDTFDPDLIGGFNHRQTNWEFSSSLQHQLTRGIAVDVGYFRRIWGNFRVTDNLAVSPADFSEFSMLVPADPRLPEGGGNTVAGIVNVRPDKFGLTDNYNTLSDKYGTQIEHWNGFDVTLNARLQNGLVMQAGVSSGKTVEDNCEIVAQLPELLDVAAAGGLPRSWRPRQFCHREEPMLTQFKMYGVYTVPKVDVQVSGTLRSTPGNDINAAFTATNAYLAANSTLGRPLSGGAANISVQLFEQRTMYVDRRNELDLRFGKVLRFGRTKSVVSLDLFNALNSDARISVNQNYATWLRPTEILNARLMKVSLQLDF
jgi:hypothetical protein